MSGVGRDLSQIRLPTRCRVVAGDQVVPWLVVDRSGEVVEPVRRFLADFVARGNRPGSVRSYAYGLLRWWRWLAAVEVEWDRATPDETRDYVLWLQWAAKPRRSPRTISTARAGTTNAITGKEYLDDRYRPRTTRHGLAVVRAFYQYWAELGLGPVVNPVQLVARGRAHAHHNPLEPFRSGGRIRYNPKVPKRRHAACRTSGGRSSVR